MLTIKTKTVPSIDVAKRDGSSVTVDIAQIPESLFADFFTDGVAEYIRDSSSSALSNAFDIAHPDHTLTGDDLKSARNKWLVGNVAAVAAESEALMAAARDRLYAGERRVARTSNTDPMDVYRVRALREVMQLPSGAAMKSAYGKIDSTDQAARKEFLLGIAAKNADWVEPRAIEMRDADRAEAAKLAESTISITM